MRRRVLSHPKILYASIARTHDNVINLVGELIIGKSMLQQALNELVKQSPKEAIRGRFADATGLPGPGLE